MLQTESLWMNVQGGHLNALICSLQVHVLLHCNLQMSAKVEMCQKRCMQHHDLESLHQQSLNMQPTCAGRAASDETSASKVIPGANQTSIQVSCKSVWIVVTVHFMTGHVHGLTRKSRIASKADIHVADDGYERNYSLNRGKGVLCHPHVATVLHLLQVDVILQNHNIHHESLPGFVH